MCTPVHIPYFADYTHAMKQIYYLRWGSFFLFLGVACGAFGAHALQTRLSSTDLGIWHTAVLYQLIHGVGLLVLAVLPLERFRIAVLRWSARLMVAGTILFSGSLYMLVLSQVRIMGAVTPLGGVAFMLAWLLLFIASYKQSE